MIFSTDRCPLCKDKLDLEVRELTTKHGGKVVFIYTCKREETIINDFDYVPSHQSHYRNESYQGGQLCQMIIPPYTLYHSESNNLTGVYKGAISVKQSKNLLFRTALLDLDYSRTHVVLTKLKLLVTFS